MPTPGADKVLYIENGEQIQCGEYNQIMQLKTKFIMCLNKTENQENERKIRKTVKVDQAIVAKKDEEQSKVGLIQWSNMINYLKASGSIWLPIVYLIWKTGLLALTVCFEVQLARFAATTDTTGCELNSANSTCPLKMRDNREVYQAFLWYSLTYVVTYILEVAASIYFFQLIVRANQNVHSLALLGVIKSPMRFFNVNSQGRKLNRFSQGFGRADTMLPMTSYGTITIFSVFGCSYLDNINKLDECFYCFTCQCGSYLPTTLLF